MNAQEARTLTDHSLSEKGFFMQVETKYVLELIKEAARNGQSSCVTVTRS